LRLFCVLRRQDLVRLTWDAPVRGFFVLPGGGNKKPASWGGLLVAAVRRALTHHSMNGANNQCNAERTAVHG
jgi:hypothetical protein